jgi:hypothetical protein
MKAYFDSWGRLAVAVACLLGTACTSLKSVSVTSVPEVRSRPVEASENNVAFLGIHFDNEFVDDLPARLQKQCPGGKIVGMFTKYESTWYVLVSDREVTVKGYCVYEEPTQHAQEQRVPPPPKAPPPPPKEAAQAPAAEESL